jgi:glycosyltransferase involved in cell wall biosynthesis
MKYSIIIPSFNQDKFIAETLENLAQLKKRAREQGIEIEILLFDNQSKEATQKIIDSHKSLFDYSEIAKDKGQYDAINKGIKKVTGDYWTWLNTDDLIEIDGFFKITDILKKRNEIDYIYGSIQLIDENGKFIQFAKVRKLKLNALVNLVPGIYQPGSFFKTTFTNKIGLLADYETCFDYEYVLRIIKNNGILQECDFTVSRFRLHTQSKTKSITTKFVKEQLKISKQYGRRFFSKLAIIAYLRFIKHRLYGTYK